MMEWILVVGHYCVHHILLHNIMTLCMSITVSLTTLISSTGTLLILAEFSFFSDLSRATGDSTRKMV